MTAEPKVEPLPAIDFTQPREFTDAEGRKVTGVIEGLEPDGRIRLRLESGKFAKPALSQLVQEDQAYAERFFQEVVLRQGKVLEFRVQEQVTKLPSPKADETTQFVTQELEGSYNITVINPAPFPVKDLQLVYYTFVRRENAPTPMGERGSHILPELAPGQRITLPGRTTTFSKTELNSRYTPQKTPRGATITLMDPATGRTTRSRMEPPYMGPPEISSTGKEQLRKEAAAVGLKGCTIEAVRANQSVGRWASNPEVAQLDEARRVREALTQERKKTPPELAPGRPSTPPSDQLPKNFIPPALR